MIGQNKITNTVLIDYENSIVWGGKETAKKKQEYAKQGDELGRENWHPQTTIMNEQTAESSVRHYTSDSIIGHVIGWSGLPYVKRVYLYAASDDTKQKGETMLYHFIDLHWKN